MRALSITLLALWAALAPDVARADRVPAPPQSCPDGARAATSHCGPTCDPWTCRSDADCQEGTCQDHRLCVDQIECTHRGGTSTRTIVTGPCGDGGSCARGTCQPQRVCLRGAQPQATPSPAPSPSPLPPDPPPPPPAEQAPTPQPEQRAPEASGGEEGGAPFACQVAARVGDGPAASVWVIAALLVIGIVRRRRAEEAL